MLPESLNFTVRESLQNFYMQVESFTIPCGCSEDILEEIHIDLKFKKQGDKVTLTGIITENECDRLIKIDLYLEDDGPFPCLRSEQIRDHTFIKEFAVTTPSDLLVYAEVDFFRSKDIVQTVDLKLTRMEMFDKGYVNQVDNNVKSDLSEILFQRDFSDLLIVVDDLEHELPEFRVHKAILASRNSTFAYILNQHRYESVLLFEGLPADMLKEIISYMYTGEMTSETLYDPIRMLESLVMFNFEESIIENCENNVITRLSEDNIVKALILAEDYRLPKLRKAGVNYFVKRFYDLGGNARVEELKNRSQLKTEIIVKSAKRTLKKTEKLLRGRRN